MRKTLLILTGVLYYALAFDSTTYNSTTYGQTIASGVQFKLPIKTSDGKITTADAICLKGDTLLYFADGKFIFISLGGSQPGPIVVPPGPIVVPPSPTPIGKPMFVVIVEETSQRSKYTSDQVKIITDKEIPDYLHSVGGDLRIVDKDATTNLGPAMKTFVDMAKDENNKWRELPWLVVSDKEGKLKYSGKLLANKNEVLILLKK